MICKDNNMIRKVLGLPSKVLYAKIISTSRGSYRWQIKKYSTKNQLTSPDDKVVSQQVRRGWDSFKEAESDLNEFLSGMGSNVRLIR